MRLHRAPGALLTTDCAANPVLGAQVNLVGTLNVFEAARSAGITRIAYASSAGVFAPGDGGQQPITHYGAFKLACERARHGVGRHQRQHRLSAR
ncbi:MAG: NAD-dependent epimerase/dehydratase family protein [Burkholderiaceae bacterium]